MKKYFKNFDYIKEVEGARTLSFISTTKNTPLSHALLLEFEDILQNHEERFRISLHNSSEDDLHNMIIGMKKGSFVFPHKHKKSESYQIIKGEMALLYFSEDGVLREELLLAEGKHLVARVEGGSYHAAIALRDTIYHETRLGPFRPKDDSFFAPCLPKEKETYMRQFISKVQG